MPELLEGKSPHRCCAPQAEAPKRKVSIESATREGPPWLTIGRRLVAAIALSLAMPGLAIAEGEDEKVNITVTLDEVALKGKPESVTSAWMGYGIARANWISENILDKPDATKSYRRCFEEELAGRESLAKIWAELKESDAKLKDDYLDQVLRIQSAGFLGEYVWSYLGSADWTQPPKQLRLEAFDKWKASNLQGHKAVTLADVKIEGEPK